MDMTFTQELEYVRELSSLTGANWEWSETGGACSCAELQLEGGVGVGDHYLLVTASDDPSIPHADEPHTLGEYLEGGISPSWWYFPNRAAMVEFLKLWIGHRFNG